MLVIISIFNSVQLNRLKFDRGLSRLLHADLYWRDIPERVQYKLGVTVRRCQQHKATQYRSDCVTPALDIASRQ